MISNFTAANVPDQTGKTFFITGADSGIGFETTKVLAAQGARVLMGCVDLPAAEAAVAQIKEATPHADVVVIPLDLAKLSSIREVAERVQREESLDILINNAGVLKPTLEMTEDGFEWTMAVNYLGHFALTGLLLPHLLQQPGSRVIMTSSMAHRAGQQSFDDMLRTDNFNSSQAYADTKLAMLWYMIELNQRLEAAGRIPMVTACHPGASVTGILRDRSAWDRWVFGLFSSSYNTPAQAAWPTLAAATSPNVEGGEYIGPGGYAHVRGPAKTLKTSKRATDQAAAARMWDLSVQLTGVNPDVMSPATR